MVEEKKIEAIHKVHKKKETKKLPLTRIIVFFGLIIIGLNAAIIFKRAMQSYELAIEEGEEYTDKAAHTLADHVELTFISVDTVLKRAVERQYFNSLFGNNLVDDMHNNIVNWVNETPQISAMLMTDENGKVRAIHNKPVYKTWMRRNSSVKTEPYFFNHSESHDSDMLYVGWQNSWAEEHDGFIVLSRRLNKLDGTFGGIVLAAVNTEYIVNFFKSVEIEKPLEAGEGGKKTKFTLLRSDSRRLIDMLQDDEPEAIIMSRVLSDKKVITAPSEDTVITREESFDNQIRIYAFKHIPALHMAVAVVVYGDDVLSDWYSARTNDIIFIAIFAMFVLVISFFALAIAKQMQRVQRSEAAAVMASQAKSDFLANMSHELRTPLNAIIGFSEMLGSGYFGKVNDKQKERTHDIHFCGTHLLELINDILEFSKGEAGKIELRSEKISVPKIIKDTLRIFADKSKKEGVIVSAKIPEDFPVVMADERKIKQILMNLLSNSVKFTNKNDTIEVSCGIDGQKNMYFSVVDTGIGMSEEDIPRALSAFGQVHNNPAYGGTGLGLPLCKMFAELHGGDLVLQSIEGVGTKVTIILPASRIVWPHSNIEQFRPSGEATKTDKKKPEKPKKSGKKKEKS